MGHAQLGFVVQEARHQLSQLFSLLGTQDTPEAAFTGLGRSPLLAGEREASGQSGIARQARRSQFLCQGTVEGLAVEAIRSIARALIDLFDLGQMLSPDRFCVRIEVLLDVGRDSFYGLPLTGKRFG